MTQLTTVFGTIVCGLARVAVLCAHPILMNAEILVVRLYGGELGNGLPCDRAAAARRAPYHRSLRVVSFPQHVLAVCGH